MNHSEMPEWIARWVRRQKCIRCRKRHRLPDLMQFGISVNGFCPNAQCFFKVKCAACHQILIVLSKGPDSMREVVARSQRDFERKDQRRQLQLPRRPRPHPVKIRSNRPKLTSQDADDLKKLLDRSQTHDDFLRSIGMTQEEIDRVKHDDNGEAGGNGTT